MKESFIKKIKKILLCIVSVMMMASVLTNGTSIVSNVSAEDLMPFVDVSTGSWYYGTVKEVNSLGLMTGTDETHFAPTKNMSRAMVATVLYRMAGSPDVTYSSQFSDVKDGLWYSKAITWAANMGIVSGYDNGKFGPTDNITREQMAVMLRNYIIKFKGYSTTSTNDLTDFSDYKSVSSYAKTAIGWAVDKGIITGYTDKTLRPTNTATRAECAKMLLQTYKLTNPITSVSLSDTSLSLTVGDTTTLTATISPNNTTSSKILTWTSSDTSVATVSDGKVTAVSAGSTTITVKTSNGKTATCKVTVTSSITSLSFSEDTYMIPYGGSTTVSLNSDSGDVTTSSDITYTSSDTSVATISSSGVVTAGRTCGTTTITATASNGVSTTCTVRVYAELTELYFQEGNITTITEIGGTGNDCLGVTMSSNTTASNEYKSLIWFSSDESVATIDENGHVTGVSNGTVTITVASYNGLSDTIEITVNATEITSLELGYETLTLENGFSKRISVKTNDDATENVTWTSSDESVVKIVKIYNAYIVAQGVSDGTATLTCTSASGKVSATCTVTVETYSYEMYLLNNNEYNIYGGYDEDENIVGTKAIIYVKTDNPDPTFVVALNNTIESYTMIVNDIQYSDIEYVTEGKYGNYGFSQVDGGYVGSFTFSKTGTVEINLYAYDITNGYIDLNTSLTINVKDYETAKEVWYQSILDEYTNDSMTDYEKMETLCNYVKNNFIYDANDGGEAGVGNIYYLTYQTGAYWETQIGDCIDVANIMCEFADMLGLDSEVTYAGYWNHHYATVYIDDESYIFDATPDFSTNVITDITYIDFSQY